MARPNDRDDSGLEVSGSANLRVSGYGPRIKQTLVVVIILAAIVAAIVLAAIWANSREPEVGVQPTPRPTQAPKPTATTAPPDTPTPEPTEKVETLDADTETPEPTKPPTEDTSTPTTEPTEESPVETSTPTDDTSDSTPTETPEPVDAPTPEPTETPTVTPTDTPVPATATPTSEPTIAATATPKPEPTSTSTSTPVPEPTATPTIAPTAVPDRLDRLVILAIGSLIDDGIDVTGMSLIEAEEHVWSDLTLGCGPIKDDNPARPVRGWIAMIGNEGQSFIFHLASEDQGDWPNLNEDIILNCTDIGEFEQQTVNLVHELRLHEARRVVLYRGLVGDEQNPIEDIVDGALIQEILDALNISIPIGNTEKCQTAFRLDFYILRGVETVRFFCEKDWFRVEGEQELWAGTQGALPQELLNSVAKYFANQPLPAIPALTPTSE